MVRSKVKIARLPTPAARQITYNKRQMGIAKKARELSILCSASLALLSFSPVGKPSLVLGENCDLSAILGRFSRVDPKERERRKRETLEVLKRNCKKQDHEVYEKLFASDGLEKVEEYHNQLRELQAKIDETNKKLRSWNNLKDIDDKAQIRMMEEKLLNSLKRIRQQKRHLVELHGRKDPYAFEAWHHSCSAQCSTVHRSFNGASDCTIVHRSKGHCEDKGKGLNLYSCQQTGGSSSGREDMRWIDLNHGNPYLSNNNTNVTCHGNYLQYRP